MNKYYCFLRGVNVGGRKIIMSELVARLETAGFRKVTTYLQSGNVTLGSALLTSDEVSRSVEEVLSRAYSYEAHVLTLTKDELMRAVEAYPYNSSDETFQHYVILHRPESAQAFRELAESLSSDIDLVSPGATITYWRVPKGMTLDSPFGKLLSKTSVRDTHTNRNLKTLQKVLAS